MGQEKHVEFRIETGQVWERNGDLWHVPRQPDIENGLVLLIRMVKNEFGLWRWAFPRRRPQDERHWTLLDFGQARLVRDWVHPGLCSWLPPYENELPG